jgi:Flp pilus assembly protein TadG
MRRRPYGPPSSAHRRQRFRGEQGVALIEFGLLLPVLAILSFGIVDLSRVYVLYDQAHGAAQQAALFAATHPGQLHSASGTLCQDPANAEWHGNNEGSKSFTYTFSSNVASCVTDPSQLPAGSASGQPLRVTATGSINLLTPIVQNMVGNPVSVSSTVCVNIGGAAPATTACHS